MVNTQDNITGIIFTEEQFAAFLKKHDDGAYIRMNNCLVNSSGSKRLIKAGIPLDNMDLNVLSTTFTGNAFAMMTLKTGDKSRINYENIAVEGEYINPKYKPQYVADHQNINIVSSKLSIVAFSVLLSNLGDNCTLHVHNCLITEEGIKACLPFKSKSTNLVVDIKLSRIPHALIGLMHQKFGERCVLDA